MEKLSPKKEDQHEQMSRSQKIAVTEEEDTRLAGDLCATPRRNMREDSGIHKENCSQSKEVGDSWMIADQWQENLGETLLLNKEELDSLDKLAHRGSLAELLADHHLHIKRSDFQTLYQTSYLNDTIVDEYLLMIKEETQMQ